MNKLLDLLLETLPKEPRSLNVPNNPGFLSDGDMILCPSESSCGVVADFLQNVFSNSSLVVQTGYYDPVEDRNNCECDKYTGFTTSRLSRILDRSSENGKQQIDDSAFLWRQL